jgi:hypothetical protein
MRGDLPHELRAEGADLPGLLIVEEVEVVHEARGLAGA